MGRVDFKPGNMLYPLPAVLISCSDGNGKDNLFTVAWTGTVCSDPPMVSISVRPERYSYGMIRDTGAFVINLTTRQMAEAVDFCGVRSGRDVDKWEAVKFHKLPGEKVAVPLVEESPVNIECRVVEVKKLGTHDMFIAEVVAVHADDRFMDQKGTFRLNDADLLVYSHGTYLSLGETLGTFGYSVRKKGHKRSLRK